MEQCWNFAQQQYCLHCTANSSKVCNLCFKKNSSYIHIFEYVQNKKVDLIPQNLSLSIENTQLSTLQASSEHLLLSITNIFFFSEQNLLVDISRLGKLGIGILYRGIISNKIRYVFAVYQKLWSWSCCALYVGLFFSKEVYNY